jgi:hypothetical protein
LIQQGGQGFGLQGDLTHAGLGLGGLVDAAHLGDPDMNTLLGKVNILPAQGDQFRGEQSWPACLTLGLPHPATGILEQQ